MILLKSLLFEQKTENKLKVLFVGDSQTAGNISYAHILKNDQLVDGKIIAKVGASMKKIYSLFINNYSPKYDVVCIMGGNNDAGNAEFDTTSFTDIIERAKEGGSDIILITCPTMEYINTKMYPNKYPSANNIPEWQLKLADEFNIPVINAYKLFNDSKYFSNDGLHLNASAHKVLANKLVNILSKISPSEISNKPEEDTDTKKLEIKFGDSNKDVQKIQTKLTDLGYSIGKEGIDSIFGTHTEDGVKLFQKNNNLSTTGVVDKETLTVLLSTSANPNTKRSVTVNNQKSDDEKSTKLSSIAKSVTNTEFPSGQVASAKVVIDFLVNKGLTKEQAIGIAANLQAESGFKTGILGDHGTSMGLAQWHADRMRNLKTWTADNNLDYMTVDGQLEFLWYELNTSEKSALNAIQSADTPEDAAYAFTVKFERPANRDTRGKERSSIATSLANKLS
jgi:peptidoglycan hydrolase-like protein with peptidoglycan-binding domain